MRFSINLVKECLGEVKFTVSACIARQESQGKKLLFDRINWMSQHIVLQPHTLYLTDPKTLQDYFHLRRLSFPEDVCFLCVGLDPHTFTGEREEYFSEISGMIPFLAVDSSYDLALIGNRCIDFFEDLREWTRKLDLMLYKNKGFQEFFDVSSAFFSSDFLMWDKSFNVLAYLDKCKTDSDVFKEIVEKGYFPKNVIENILRRNLLDVTVGNDVTRTIPATDTATQTELLVRHFCCNGFRIYSIAYFNRENRIHPGERELLEVFFDYMIRYLEQFEAQEDDEFHRSGDVFFHDILSGAVKNPREISEKAQAFHIAPDVRYICYVIRLEQYSKTKARYLINYFLRIMPTEHVFEHNQDVVFIKNIKNYNCVELGRVSSFEHLLETSRAWCGISSVFTELRHIPDAYKQSDASIRLGRLMKEESGPIFFYKTYYYYHILEIVNKELDLRMMYNKKLNRVLDDDQRHNSNNIHLLETLIRNNLSATDTAAELFLHRNSVIYRMKKLEQLLDIDFSNHKEIERLNFSLLCQRYLKALEGNPPKSL